MILTQMMLFVDSIADRCGLSIIEDLVYRKLLLDLHQRSWRNNYTSYDLMLLKILMTGHQQRVWLLVSTADVFLLEFDTTTDCIAHSMLLNQ